MKKIMSKVIKKVRSIYKNEDRKLLEDYGIIDPKSSMGVDGNGFFLEDLTEEGEELLTQHLWTKYREEILEVLRKVKEVDDKKKKKDKK